MQTAAVDLLDIDPFELIADEQPWGVVEAKYNPNQLRDPGGEGGGRWIKAPGGAVDAGLDKLKLAGRIQLGHGERLVGSNVFESGGAAIPMALTSGPGGRRLRIGTGIDPADKKRWAGRNLGQTANLDENGIRQLRSALDQMRVGGDEGGKRFRALEERADELDQRRRDVLKRQHRNLSKSDAKRLDQIDRRIEQIDTEIAGAEDTLRRKRTFIANEEPDKLPRWQAIDAEIATLDPERDRARIEALQTEQARMLPSPAASTLRVMRAPALLREEREQLELERGGLTADPTPLTDQDRADLAAVDAEIAANQAALAQMEESTLVEGVIPGEWADLIYEVNAAETTYEYDNMGITYKIGARPHNADDDWELSEDYGATEFEPKDLDKLAKTLDDLIGDQSKTVTAHLPGQHNQQAHAGIDTLGSLSGLRVLDAGEYERSYGDLLDEQVVSSEDGVDTVVRVFQHGDAHIVLDLPGGRHQVMSDFDDSGAMRALSSDIRTVQHAAIPDSDPFEVRSGKHDYIVAKDEYGDIRLREASQAEDDYLELSEDEAWDLFDALEAMADSYDDEFAQDDQDDDAAYEEDDDSEDVQARSVSVIAHLPGLHNQKDHGRKKALTVSGVPSAPEPKQPGARKPRKAPSAQAPTVDAPKRADRKPSPARGRISPAAAQKMQDGMLSGRPWTAENRRSLQAWTTSGYHDIRMMIENPDHEPFTGHGGPATVKAHVRNIHGAMRPLPKPVKAFRRVGFEALGLKSGDDPARLVGQKRQNNGFTATSIDPDAAFLGAPRPVHIEIDIPAGTPAAYLEELTETKGELELLLDAGLVLEYTAAKRRRDGVIELKARVIG